jgi:hypothetical protein
MLTARPREVVQRGLRPLLIYRRNTGIYPWVMRGKMLTLKTFSTALPVVSTRTSSTGSSEKPIHW